MSTNVTRSCNSDSEHLLECRCCTLRTLGLLLFDGFCEPTSSVLIHVNKGWTHKDKEKDQTYKDSDLTWKDKELESSLQGQG